MSDDLCRKCGHPSGPHVLAATVWCTLPIGTEIVVIDRREEDVYTVEPFKTKLD